MESRRIRHSQRQWVVTGLAAATLVAVGFIGALAQNASPICFNPDFGIPVARSPVQHLFLIVKENHAFENYFGTLPGVDGHPPNGTLPTNFSGSGTIHPFPLNSSSTPDLPHDRTSDVVDLNGGRDDLFVAQAASLGYPDPNVAAGYYSAQQIPDYFAYAQAYGVADHFFSGIMGPTLPNRIFDIAGTSGNWTSDDVPPPSAVNFPTVLNQLEIAGLPWTYDYSGEATNLAPLVLPMVASNPCMIQHVEPIGELPAQLAGAAPPSVTFVDDSNDIQTSEHPPGNVTAGEQWTVALVNAIARSPIGPSSAIFVFWDENGGFWDPVVPPIQSSLGDGFRVPLLVLSPWTRPGVIIHSTLDPASLLRFVDDNWGLPYLNARVSAAPRIDPFFNFTTAPRPWLVLSTPYTIGSSSGYGSPDRPLVSPLPIAPVVSPTRIGGCAPVSSRPSFDSKMPTARRWSSDTRAAPPPY